MFDADRPIIKSSQDRLNRSLFAKYLARCMLDHVDPESLVIGLYGKWGVGKTSIINMTVEELNFAASNMFDDEKPIILNFSPWSYSGQHRLIYSFFRRLSSTLRSFEFLENKDQIIYLLELYVSFFTQQPVPTPLRKKPTLLQKITLRKPEEVYAWESGRDLTLVKSELNELLRQQKHKIIIIIDNISRLYDYEIKQIFQIVKSIGDYANTTYLLAFDKTQVVRAINQLDGSGGEDFVEKIVQLPFEIPPILAQDLESIFADRLTQILSTVPEDAWNVEYWADIYYTSLRNLFHNVRDITRYVNTLNFSYPRLRDVVNPVDFFTLTAIEIFMPQVYFGIRDNKDLFSDLLDHVYELTPDVIEKDKQRCDEILSRTNRVSHETLLELLFILFPRLRKIYQPNVTFFYSDALARGQRRICSPDLFDVYFRLSMQASELGQNEFETLLSQAGDQEAFDHELSRLNQDDRIIKFLDKLDSRVLTTIPRNNIQHIISALLDDGDTFPQGISGQLSLDTPMRIHRIIHTLLQRLDSQEERFIILQNAIAKATKSIYIIVHELKEQMLEHTETTTQFMPLEFRDLTTEQLDSLRHLAVTRIESWASSGRLAEHPQIIPLLYAWRDWGDEAACRRYVEKLTKTDPGLLIFLTSALGPAIDQAMTAYEKNPAWEAYLADIEAFVPVKSLEAHAKTLFEDQYFEKLREREQLSLMIFLDLIHAETNKVMPKTTV